MNFSTPYFIDARIEEALNEAIDPETGEIIDEDKLDLINRLNIEKDEAIEEIGLYYKDVVATAKAVKDEKDNLAAKQKALEKRAEGIKKQLGKMLDGQKYKSPRLSISFKKSEAVVIEDVSKLPPECLVWPKPTADKRKILTEIKEGKEVAGATVEAHKNIIIK